MISALGQIVWQNNVNGNSTELDVSELPPGMYVLMIQTEAGLIEKQIVKK
jgi:Secretion system C-terminal sorting domain